MSNVGNGIMQSIESAAAGLADVLKMKYAVKYAEEAAPIVQKTTQVAAQTAFPFFIVIAILIAIFLFKR